MRVVDLLAMRVRRLRALAGEVRSLADAGKLAQQGLQAIRRNESAVERKLKNLVRSAARSRVPPARIDFTEGSASGAADRIAMPDYSDLRR